MFLDLRQRTIIQLKHLLCKQGLMKENILYILELAHGDCIFSNCKLKTYLCTKYCLRHTCRTSYCYELSLISLQGYCKYHKCSRRRCSNSLFKNSSCKRHICHTYECNFPTLPYKMHCLKHACWFENTRC